MLAVYASAPGSPPTPQDSLPAVPSALAGRGWLPARFHFEVSAHRILLNQTWLAHQGDRETRRPASVNLGFEPSGPHDDCAVLSRSRAARTRKKSRGAPSPSHQMAVLGEVVGESMEAFGG